MKTPQTFYLSAGDASFHFDGMEIPSALEGLGGKKLAALIQLEGGTRVVQTFGNVPHNEISWHGLILGPNSFQRWAQLDGFRTSASPVTLVYGPFTLIGILEETQLLPGFEGYLPYHAKLLVQRDASNLNIPLVPPQTIDQSGNQAVSAAMTAAQNAQAAGPAISITGVQAAVAVLAAQQAIAGSLTTAQVTSPGALGAAQLLVNAAAAATFALFGQDPIDVNATVFPLYVALTALGNLLDTLPVSPQVTVLVDGRLNNLFQLATRYGFGPDGWIKLSAANGGIGPFWTGLLSVIIPSPNG